MDVVRHRAAEQRLWTSVGLTVSERRLHLDRTDVDVRVQEVGDGPVVLFVHGASNTGTSWAPLVAQLAGLRCVLLDRPGCGLSDPVATRFHDVDRLAAFADDLLVDVLDALDVEVAPLVTTSFGGYIGLRSVAARPDRFPRLLEIGWSIGAPIGTTPVVMRLAMVPGLNRLLLRIPPNERMVKMILEGAGLRQAIASGRFSAEALAWYLSVLRDTDTMRNEVRAGPRILTPIKGLNESILLPPELLAAVKVPTHFIWGDGDPFGGAEIARAFSALIPGATLEMVPGAGHAPWIDEPELVARAAQAFLTA